MRRLGAHVLLTSLLFLGACGYSTDSLLPEGVETVAVDVFGNETFYREIEFQLTRQLSGQVIKRTPWTLAKRGKADAVITGRILSVGRPTLVENRDDLVSEQAVIVRAEVFLTAADGRILEHFVEANRAEYIVERGETLDTAFAECLADLAEQIINHLQHRSFLKEMGVDPRSTSGPASRPSADSGAAPESLPTK